MPEKAKAVKETTEDKKPVEVSTEAVEAEEVTDTDVVVSQASALTKTGERQRGMDDFEAEDLILPRAIMMQPMSPAVQDDDIEIKPGELLNNITHANYGSTLTVIPVMFKKKRIKWNPRPPEGEGGIQCASMFSGGRKPDTGERHSNDCKRCAYSQWGKAKDEPPQCDIIFEFLCIILDDDLDISTVMERVVAIGFTRTSAKAGQTMANLAKFAGGDIFSRCYKIATKKVQKDKFTWWELTATPAGRLDDGQYAIAEHVFNMLDTTDFVVLDDEDEVEVATETDAGSTGFDGESEPF